MNIIASGLSPWLALQDLVNNRQALYPAKSACVKTGKPAAFRQALLAASARAPLSALDSETKPPRKASSYTLLTGFEDTELPESAASPALSKTQYGDLH